MSAYPDLAAIKAWLNITGTTDDSFLTHKLAVTIGLLERYTNRKFPLARYTEKFHNARCGADKDGLLFLKAVPIKVVHGVSASGWQQTGFGAICIPGYFRCFSEAQPQTIVVDYEGGFDPIPPEILDAIYNMMAAAHAKKGTVASSAGAVKKETVFGVASVEYETGGGAVDTSGSDPMLPAYYASILDSYRMELA